MSTQLTQAPLSPAAIRAAADLAQLAAPRLRARDLAEQLGISEGELVASRCGTGTVTRLSANWSKILARLDVAGPLMALTRNATAVLECTGVYARVRFEGEVGGVFTHGIDLRIFLDQWAQGYCVEWKFESANEP